MPARADLPTDVDTLQRMVLEQSERLLSKQIEVEQLKLEVARLRRWHYGRSSEQLDGTIRQLELSLEELEASRAAVRAVRRARDPQSVQPDPPVRQALPDHLPREEQRAPNPCSCPECGGALRYLGEDVSEQLERLPEQFKVIRQVREKFSCSACDTIIQAPAASRPIERGIAAPGLLAHVLVSKFCDYLPLYRQTEIYARSGVDLPRSTLADWVGACAQLLTPLADAIRAHVMGADKLHADDTPIPVLMPGRGTTKEARLWIYACDDRPSGSDRFPAVWFAYTPDRKHIHPATHLQDFAGILQSDGYEGFEKLWQRPGVTGASCWSHARRKFHDIHQADASPVAFEALERIGALYEIEAQIRGRPPSKRAAVRRVRAGPLLEELRQWMLQALTRCSKKSALALAIRYSLTRWTSLTRYVQDGRIEIDNNAAERALRGVALGRKNFLFVGSDAGGQRAAVIYTLVESAKLYGLDPEDYLRRVLARIADHQINRIAELLPWNLSNASTERAEAA